MRYPRFLSRTFFCLLLFGAQATRSQQYEPVFEQFTLSNGLRVILHRDSTLPRISVNLTWHAGSARDPRGLSGLASIAANLVLAGAGDIPFPQYVRLQSEAGAGTAGMTDVDWTTIYSSYDMRYIETALWIEASRMKSAGASVTKEMLAVVVRRTLDQKRRSAAQPLGDFQEAIYHEIFPKGYPYYHVTSGDTSEIKKIKTADVVAFLQRYYVPANACLTIGGHFLPAEAKSFVRRYFEALPAGRRATWDAKKMALPPFEAASLIKQAAVELSELHLVFPGATIADADEPLLAIASKVLTGSPTSRLVKALAVNGVNVVSVRSSNSSQELHGTFTITVVCKPEMRLQAILEQVQAVLDHLTVEPLTDDELSTARNAYEAEFLSALETYEGLGGRCDLLNLGTLYTDNPALFFGNLLAVRSASRLAVQDAIIEHLGGANMLAVSIVQPGKTHLGVTIK